MGIETSGEVCGVALSRGKTVLATIQLFRRNIHSQELSPAIESVLQLSGESVENLDAIILSAGPGSFTGLRIGYSVAKGLAFALEVPVVEVPTLDLLAWQVGPVKLPILTVMDARRSELYTARYQRDGDELLRLTEFEIATPQQIAERITDPHILIGKESGDLGESLGNVLHPHSVKMIAQNVVPDPRDLILLGERKYSQKLFSDSESCEPLYLRPFQGVS